MNVRAAYEQIKSLEVRLESVSENLNQELGSNNSLNKQLQGLLTNMKGGVKRAHSIIASYAVKD